MIYFLGFGYQSLCVPALELLWLKMEKESQSPVPCSEMVQQKSPCSYLAEATGERPKYTFLVVFELISPRKPPVGQPGGEANTRIQRVEEGKPMNETLSPFPKICKAEGEEINILRSQLRAEK